MMNNIRKIITERLENARLDFNKTTREFNAELKGSILAYQDCLNLIDEYEPEIIIPPINIKEFNKRLANENEKFTTVPDNISIYATRTEQDILNDFEKLGYEVIVEKDHIRMSGYEDVCLYIDLKNKSYSKNKYLQDEDITMQEHKLLNELFICWGWL